MSDRAAPMAMRETAQRALGGAALAVVLLGSPVTAAAQPQAQSIEDGDTRVRVTVDAQRMRLSDLLRLTLEVEAPGDLTASLPRVDERLGDFRVLERHPLDPDRLATGPKRWRREYVLEPTEAGTLSIPALVVELEQAAYARTAACTYLLQCTEEQRLAGRGRGKGRSRVVSRPRTEPIEVEVSTVLADAADIYSPRDIASPAGLPSASAGRAPLGYAAGAMLALAVLGLVWWHRRSRAARDEQETAPTAFDSRAAEALDELEASALMDERQAEAFYLRLAEILRRYVEARFALPALRRTTEELLIDLAPVASAAPRDVLHACDHVKFGIYRPRRAQMHDALSRCRAFVHDRDSTVLPASGATASAPGI